MGSQESSTALDSGVLLASKWGHWLGDPGQTKANCASGYTFTSGYRERFVGNSPKPRLAIGVGVNWVSPFGPLRIDLAKAILKQEGDDTKLFSFNVGTQF